MAGRRIVVQFLGEDKSLTKTADKAEGRMSKLGGRMAKVGKIAALGLAGGVATAGVALFKMGQAAAEDEASQKRLAKTLQNTTGATKAQVAGVEDWISAQGRALGVADDELRPALEKLVSATHDVGKAQKLASLAMDISAGTGKSLEAVSMALAKAQNGNVSALGRLGVNVKDAEGKTISFEQAQKRLGKTFKGQATTAANTFEGKVGRLKLALSETGEEIGAKLLPTALKLADWFLNDGLPKMQAFGNYLSRTLPPIFQRIQAVVRAVMDALRGDVGGNLNGIKQIFRDAVSIITSIWRAFGPGLVAFIKPAFAAIKAIVKGAFTVIRGIFKTVSALLKGDWKGVWDGIKTILRGAATALVGIVKLLWNTVKLIFRSAGVALKGMVRTTWSGAQTLFRAGVNGIVNLVRGIPGKIGALGGLMARAGKNLLQSFLDGMKNAAGFIGGIAGNVWSAVKGLLNGAIDKINNALEFRIDTPGPGGFDINPPNIPHLAKGGTVTKPTLALIGEDGPEAVVPLGAKNRPRGSMPGLGGGGGNTYNFTINGFVGSEDRLVEKLEQMMIRYNRNNGRRLQMKTTLT